MGGQRQRTGPVESDLVYDWNQVAPASCSLERPPRIVLNDETLRDGLQSPSVRQPSLEQKQAFLRRLPPLGIAAANLGYPGAGPALLADVVALAQTLAAERLPIQPNCAGRTHVDDILPILEAQERSGVAIDAALFIGSSRIRQWVEGWDLAYLLRTVEAAVTFATSRGLAVMFVTEDTTRAHPDDIAALYLAAAGAGASRVCLADTVGHATPTGVQALARFVRERLAAAGFEWLPLDWHGHRDRGLDLVNAMAALSAGVERVHGCALGIGERAGNTAMDLLLVNLALLGWMDLDLASLPEYVRLASVMTGIPVEPRYPVVGADVFTTSTGVHAAAVAKAQAKGDAWLADRIYSAVPAGMVGRCQTITVGPMSGRSNALCWLQAHGLEGTPARLAAILEAAKQAEHVLDEAETQTILDRLERRRSGRDAAVLA